MRIKIYFAIANIVALVMLFGFVVHGQISNLQLQASTINIRERQLQSLELNYQLQEDNLQLLAEFGIARPMSRTGEVLTDVLIMLREQDLRMLEFNASEYALHDEAIETRATIVCEGHAQDIIAFLYDLSQHESHIQIWRTQIYEEEARQQLRLTFSVFEERRH